ncbi:SsgA family sporulation/cell division regulator [Kitasatospora sp. NPDC048365]|uniref:SsgA family sporulation/cell division regulator n=1 Tax=Kitasatospora sp. NPDC048365 TaxID=3364050 RepID=UPI00371DD2E1
MSGGRIPRQRTAAGGVVDRIDTEVVVAPGLTVPVPACLRYDPAEPYAVHLDMQVYAGAPVRWTFARDLLATGTTTWAGGGDVSVFPDPAPDAERDTVFISLTGEESTAVLRVPTAVVRAFLARSERIVPIGDEHHHVEVANNLRPLFDDRPPSRPRFHRLWRRPEEDADEGD